MEQKPPFINTNMATTPVPPQADKNTKAKLHAESLRKQAGELVGKPGHNPFIWIRENLVPLEDALAKGSADAADKILSLKLDTTVTNDGPKEVPPKA